MLYIYENEMILFIDKGRVMRFSLQNAKPLLKFAKGGDKRLVVGAEAKAYCLIGGIA